jgi:hypothetical protein
VPPPPDTRAPDPLQEEVIANILAQPSGRGTVAGLGLPRPFLGGVADRIIRASFQEHFRAFEALLGGMPGQPPPPAEPAPVRPTICWPDLSAEEIAWWRSLPEVRPESTFAAVPPNRGAPTPRPVWPFRQTIPGFRMVADDGSEPIGALRLHLTGDSHWAGPGAGDSLEVSRQLAAAFPDLPILACVHEGHGAGAARLVATWHSPGRFTLLPQALPVSQWAQDNAKAGLTPEGTAVLLPRFASRAEDGAIHIPGDSLAGVALAAAGVRTGRSPLLFQGGNLLMVTDPRQAGGRLLLIGEAEIHRNAALWLTEGRAQESLRIELGADRSAVLPAVSFHLDFDVLVRSAPRGPIAFVNDPLAAARLIIREALPFLAAGGILDRPAAAQLGALADPGADGALLAPLVPFLMPGSDGSLIVRLAPHFTARPGEPAAPNLRLLFLALDVLAAATWAPSQWPADPNLRGYLRTFQRQAADREALHAFLRDEGFRVVPIPSISEQRTGLSYLNGVNTPGRLLIPAWGGRLAAIDNAVIDMFRRELPDVAIQPIFSAETQRRAGGPHCAAGLVPALVP